MKEGRRVAGLAAVGMSEQREDGGTHNILSIFFKGASKYFLDTTPLQGECM